MKLTNLIGLLSLIVLACNTNEDTAPPPTETLPSITKTSLIVLGTLQDGGSPHAGCTKACCKDLFAHHDPTRQVVSLGVIDPHNKKSFLFEATPDLPTQMKSLKNLCPFTDKETPDGIFLTHAHIGHYSGLMFLGREAMNAQSVPVYAMPRMKTFLESNGPWSQLVSLNNIVIVPLEQRTPATLTSNLKVTPFLVPHRDEYSETVGYVIEGPSKKALFIPDIDKWEKWEQSIAAEVAKVDYAFLDATFFDGEEVKRDMSEIPHPFIVESMQKLKGMPSSEKNKIHFIHFNHTNPVLDKQSAQAQTVYENGFRLAQFQEIFEL